MNLDRDRITREWPSGWAIRVDPYDPASGRLVADDWSSPSTLNTTVATNAEGGGDEATTISG